jgi:hypothetical protein
VDSWAGSACYPRSTFYPLSDGPSTRDHRITRPGFRLCSARRPRSQPPLCPCTPRRISKPPEGSFGRLRYCLGGFRPRQTTHLPRSRPRVYGVRLGFRSVKGGISPAPPRPPKGALPRLPPILRMTLPNPRIGCSEGSRGLSVWPRVDRIFTATSISPGAPLRQCPSRYAFHAGRNLPDKEFRYLRTVIVTAAVYRGFGSEPRRHPRAPANPSP